MTLHSMGPEHYDFMVDCFITGGQSASDARARANLTFEIAFGYADPVFFVGPCAENPRYFLGAYVDVNGRAVLTVGTTDFDAAPTFRDAHQWIDYLLNELQLILIEAYVWVEDLQKEWYLRGLGFKKGGVIPAKVDIPGKNPQKALSMYIEPSDFTGVTRNSFREMMKKYKAHRNKLREERSTA